MTALDVLHAVTQAGGRLTPNGGTITMETAAQLPAALIAQVRQYKAALLAILSPNPPRHAGGFSVTLENKPCMVCGGVDWQQHVTYRYCLACGQQADPGAVPVEVAHDQHDTRAVWEERSAILEYDAGLSRDDAEWQAYLCAKGARCI